MNTILNFFTSLRLTVVCLIFALGLVFFGTLAQVKWGLYIVQANYFHSLLIYWQPQGSSWKIPIYPGGYLIGTILLINLFAAHIKRFELSRKKFGITVIHSGLILLLVGQLFTELFQVESAMRIPEGETRNYSESPRFSELAIVDKTDAKQDKVVAIPATLLGKKKEIQDPNLPFKLEVKDFAGNSEPALNRGSGELILNKTKAAVKMNDRDVPFANIQILTDEGVKGPFTVSNWHVEPELIGVIQKNFGTAVKPSVFGPRTFTYKNHTYELAMRPVRYYKPYSIKLLNFTHERYQGTEIPKNFSSRVQLVRPSTGENRETLIYMNNPLRYAGETYYQGGYQGDTVTILQDVRNPGWITPYVACTMVGLSLLIQFLSHLINFTKKSRA